MACGSATWLPVPQCGCRLLLQGWQTPPQYSSQHRKPPAPTSPGLPAIQTQAVQLGCTRAHIALLGGPAHHQQPCQRVGAGLQLPVRQQGQGAEGHPGPRPLGQGTQLGCAVQVSAHAHCAAVCVVQGCEGWPHSAWHMTAASRTKLAAVLQ